MKKQNRTLGKPYEVPECSVDWLSWEQAFLTATTESYPFNPSGNPFHSKANYGYEEDDYE